MSRGQRGSLNVFFFFKKSLRLLKIHVEIFTVKMICCPEFASKESKIVGRRVYGMLQREQNHPGVESC